MASKVDAILKVLQTQLATISGTTVTLGNAPLHTLPDKSVQITLLGRQRDTHTHWWLSVLLGTSSLVGADGASTRYLAMLELVDAVCAQVWNQTTFSALRTAGMTTLRRETNVAHWGDPGGANGHKAGALIPVLLGYVE